jgi:hypothetical protein
MAVNANVGGSVSGQLTIGDHNVQLRADGGTLVYVAPPAPPRAQPRPRPVVLRPRRPAAFVDRTAELAAIVRALGTGPALVELSGAPGVGKTALLRTVAYDASTGRFGGGVVYLAQSDGPFEDVLFEIGDALFAFEGGYVPTHVQLRHLLTGADALLLLDDLEADRAQVEQLFDAIPDASVVYAASASRGLDSTVRIGLGPFAADDMRALAAASGANPATVAGALAAPAVPADVLRVAGGVPPASPAAFAGLSDAERAVLGVLALVPSDRIPASVLVDVAGRPDAAAAIASLARRRLVESEARSEEAVRLAPDVALLPEARAFAGTGASPRRLLTALIEGVRSAVEVRRRAAPVEHLAAAVLASGDARMVLWLAQMFGEYLAAAGALGRWQRLLELGRNAALALGDRAAEAWALHQLGTRALLAGDPRHAEALLRQALSIRTAIGDGTGIRATQHNLDVLLGVPPPPAPPRVRPAGGSGDGGDFPVGMLAFVAVIVIAAVVALGVMLYQSGGLPGSTPAPVVSESPSPVPEETVPPTPIPLLLPTLTPEPTATPESPSPSPRPTDTASPGASPAATASPFVPNRGGSPTPDPTVTTATPTAAPTATPTPAATAAPLLSIKASAADCPTGPGLRYAINGGATSLAVIGGGGVPVVVPSPPAEGCITLQPGRYLLRAARDGKSALTFAFVRAPPTIAPPPHATPVPTPRPTPVPPTIG